VQTVRFINPAPFKADSLITVVKTQPTRCNLLGLPLCVPFTRVGQKVSRFNLQQMNEDVARLQTFYRVSGYFGTTVVPKVTEKGDNVEVAFTIEAGDPVQLDSFTVAGTEGIMNPDSLVRALPLDTGRIFHLGLFNASADTVLRALQTRGHAYAQVLRNYSVDTLSNRAVASLTAVPGPRVVVDSIIVNGARNLGRSAALRQLTFRKGSMLQASKLLESQRNLYSLDLIQLASVTMAPESLDVTPKDSSRATVLVTIAETKVNQVDAAVGFGTVECMRTEAQYINRSFMGGARRLALTGSVSKIGLGGATGIGVGQSLCRAFAQDSFENTLDYRLSADFTQPYFLSPLNHLTLHAYKERVSEPSVFQREAEGGQVLLTRRLTTRTLLNAGLNIEHGRTIANAVVFCAAFQVCVSEEVDSLSRFRFINTASANLVRDRTDFPLDPTTGNVFRSGVTWAADWLASDVTFLRWNVDGAAYRELQPGWVLAASLRLGGFFQTATLTPGRNFLPPEQRFYAGGANTVRGYARNQLGSVVYVTDEVETDSLTGERVPVGTPQPNPIGGTSLVIGNLELRFPSPYMPRRFRLAVFVDGGTIGTGNFWDLDNFRFTPGAGLRIQTPVGPARLDAAYLPYGPQIGPLFVTEDGALVRVTDDFRPEQGNFFSRFRLHVAIGQAF
jgi:outer membrane protein assembly factor BamA